MNGGAKKLKLNEDKIALPTIGARKQRGKHVDICGCTSPPKGEKMKNWEKYEEEIKKIGVGNMAIDKNGKTGHCVVMACRKCIGYKNGCDRTITEWLYQEAE